MVCVWHTRDTGIAACVAHPRHAPSETAAGRGPARSQTQSGTMWVTSLLAAAPPTGRCRSWPLPPSTSTHRSTNASPMASGSPATRSSTLAATTPLLAPPPGGRRCGLLVFESVGWFFFELSEESQNGWNQTRGTFGGRADVSLGWVLLRDAPPPSGDGGCFSVMWMNGPTDQ